MKNQNITFQQLIEKLKTIDVADLLEKAKSIKVDDLRSIKISDLKEITKSIYFYPTLGIILASISSIFFLQPSIESLKNRQAKSSQYKNESFELPLIKSELNKRLKTKKTLEDKYNSFLSLVPKKADLIFLTEILYDSSKRSDVEIIEFAPIINEDLNTCTTESEEEMFNANFSENNNFEDNSSFDDMNIENDVPPLLDEPPLLDDYSIDNFSKLEVYEFYINLRDGLDEFERISKNINQIFESNYFLIKIKSNYLNSLKFLKFIQEYKMMILPYCFEPQIQANLLNRSEQNDNSANNGEIEARIIVNIPNYKEN